jgi:hypothetical protein
MATNVTDQSQQAHLEFLADTARSLSEEIESFGRQLIAIEQQRNATTWRRNQILNEFAKLDEKLNPKEVHISGKLLS